MDSEQGFAKRVTVAMAYCSKDRFRVFLGLPRRLIKEARPPSTAPPCASKLAKTAS